MSSGIYGIFDCEGVCLYVGQSSDIPSRWEQHKKNLKYGNSLESFCTWFVENGSSLEKLHFEVLELCDNIDSVKNSLEIKWFNELSPKFYGKVPSTKDQWSHSNETKLKISNTLKSNLSPSYSDRVLICIICGGEFSSKRLDAKLCSESCKEAFLETRGRINDTLADKICRLYTEDNLSLRGVSYIAGVSHISVRNTLLKRGIILRSK